jgi:hypothetical protein
LWPRRTLYARFVGEVEGSKYCWSSLEDDRIWWDCWFVVEDEIVAHVGVVDIIQIQCCCSCSYLVNVVCCVDVLIVLIVFVMIFVLNPIHFVNFFLLAEEACEKKVLRCVKTLLQALKL